MLSVALLTSDNLNICWTEIYFGVKNNKKEVLNMGIFLAYKI